MDGPNCYSDVERIRDVLESRNCDDFVIHFFRKNQLFEGEADHAASLILLEGSEQWRIRADLNISPELRQLPLIKRTGTSSPWMRAHLLGFQGDVVTDPDLQRARCLFLSTRAAIEEWISLLLRIFEMPAVHRPFQQEQMRIIANEVGLRGGEWLDILCTLLSEQYNVVTNQLSNRSVPDEFMHFIEARLGCNRDLPAWVEQYLRWQIGRLKPSEKDPNPSLLRNLLTALLLALRDVPYRDRHLGPSRLNRIVNPEKRHGCNLVVQGVGDLSMNEWNVMFYHEHGNPQVFLPENEPFSNRIYSCLIVWKDKDDASLSSKIEEAKSFISKPTHDPTHPIGVSLKRDLSIAQLRFSPGKPYLTFPGKHPDDLALHELIDFAVYGKLVLREGEIVEPAEIVDQFLDLRHVFKLPNINPKDDGGILAKTVEHLKGWISVLEKLKNDLKDDSEQLSSFIEEFIKTCNLNDSSKWEQVTAVAEKIWKRCDVADAAQVVHNVREELEHKLDEESQFLVSHFSELHHLLTRPRDIFGSLQETDVWLLEYALLSDRSLRHLACTSSNRTASNTIAVDLKDLGAPKSWIDFCLLREGYRRRAQLYEVGELGDFAWDENDPSNPRLNIRLKMQTYPCTIIGIGSLASPQDSNENDILYMLAWGHDFDRGGHTIWDCAKVLKAAGAYYALVIDEGQDVFQCHISESIWEKVRQFYEEEEENYEPLAKWMPVPLAFEAETANKPRTLRRRGLRATLAFWQDRR
jgi:hypothetical protein